MLANTSYFYNYSSPLGFSLLLVVITPTVVSDWYNRKTKEGRDICSPQISGGWQRGWLGWEVGQESKDGCTEQALTCILFIYMCVCKQMFPLKNYLSIVFCICFQCYDPNNNSNFLRMFRHSTCNKREKDQDIVFLEYRILLHKI